MLRQVIPRRAFLKAALGLCAFIGVFKYLAVDRLFKVGAASDSVYPPEFLAGQVIELTPSGFVARIGQREQTVAYGAATRAWKKDWQRLLPVQIGDSFVAWGEPQEDGTYVPATIYFNIVNLYGNVSELSVGPDQATFAVNGRRKATFVADASALVDSGQGEAAFEPANPPFENGAFIQVVAVRTNNVLVATRILV